MNLSSNREGLRLMDIYEEGEKMTLQILKTEETSVPRMATALGCPSTVAQSLPSSISKLRMIKIVFTSGKCNISSDLPSSLCLSISLVLSLLSRLINLFNVHSRERETGCTYKRAGDLEIKSVDSTDIIYIVTTSK
jgi:hypothetical protein